MADHNPQGGSFRDNLATIDKTGKRVWVYPNQPGGRFYTARTWTGIFLLAFLFGAPFIKVGGQPFLLFDILNRKFFILGSVFWPQDFYLFVLAVILLVVFIILFTAAFGRLFCGWACPQTIFLEMVYRRIEYFIEGNGPRQRELARAPWTMSKILKKGSKQVIFYAIAFLIGNTFLAYFIGIEQLWSIMTDPPSQHLTGLAIMIIFSLVFYWVFAWFREQACTLVCPYGRLQSVLLDNNSIVVAYDFRRGEPRAPAQRNDDFAKRGHCIDCAACVKVCPTGIDIRNGTQLECVNCTACIDACDRVMNRMKLPTGLIRYSSYNTIAHGQKFRFTGRIKIYSVILVVLLLLMSGLLMFRSDTQTTILRASGSLYEELADGSIRNLYTVRVINKSGRELPISLKIEDGPGKLELVGPALKVEPGGTAESVFIITVPKNELFSSSRLMHVGVYSDAERLEKIRTTFSAPMPGHDKEHHDDEHD